MNMSEILNSPLDPLLERLSRKYVDNEDLSSRLKTLYHVVLLSCHSVESSSLTRQSN
jgi:hypothetical protein